jgi:uncharacterized protein (DUF488 family)
MPAPSPIVLYTAGHGNRRVEDLLALLRSVGVTNLVDVRAQPFSRRHPQFEGQALRIALEQAGLVYHWAGRALGGLRPPRPDSAHSALAEAGLRGFADHMETETFRQAAAQLVKLAARVPCAILCAEKDPTQCHRSLIADYLTWQGVRVIHLIEPGHLLVHRLDRRARPDGLRLVYDRTGQQALDLD